MCSPDLDLDLEPIPGLESGPGAWGLDFGSRHEDLGLDLETWGPNLWSRPGVLETEPGAKTYSLHLELEP